MISQEYDLLIFDLDGTLIRSQKDISISVNFVRSAFGLGKIKEKRIRSFIGDGVKVLIRRAFPALNRADLLRAKTIFRKHYSKHCLDNTVVFPGIPELLKKLDGKKAVVLTNKPKVLADKILSGLKIKKYFGIVLGGDSRYGRKPKASPVEWLIRKTRSKNAYSIVIGDGINDIKSAKAAGIASVGLGYGYTVPEKLLKLKPDYFVQSVSKLQELINGGSQCFS